MAIVFGLKYKVPMECFPLAVIDEETELQINSQTTDEDFLELAEEKDTLVSQGLTEEQALKLIDDPMSELIRTAKDYYQVEILEGG